MKYGFWVQLRDRGSGLPTPLSVGECVYLITLDTWAHCSFQSSFTDLNAFDSCANAVKEQGLLPHVINPDTKARGLSDTLSIAGRKEQWDGTLSFWSPPNAFLTTSCCVIFLVPTVLKCHNIKHLCHYAEPMSLFGTCHHLYTGNKKHMSKCSHIKTSVYNLNLLLLCSLLDVGCWLIRTFSTTVKKPTDLASVGNTPVWESRIHSLQVH